MQANSNILSNRLSDPTDDQAAVRLSRRAAVRALMAAAASALARPHVAGAQSAAPAGEPSPIGDLGMELSIDQRSAGITLLKHYASIDTHCHPGRFFLGQLPYATPMTRAFGEPFVEQAIADLSSANVSAALFAAVADMRLLEMTPTGIRANGAFQAGEAYADYKRQINQLQALIAQHKLARGLTPANVFSAHQHRQTALIFAVEGGDFIEDRLDRLHQAFLDGVRAITIVHISY